ATVSGLPTGGMKIYARLNSLINGAWQYIDYTYTGYGAPSPATLLTPAPSPTPPYTQFVGSSQSFTWSAGSGVTAYDLWVGTTGVGSHNLYYPPQTTSLQATVAGLPTNGATIYVRLNSLINGAWQSIDYTYAA